MASHGTCNFLRGESFFSAAIIGDNGASPDLTRVFGPGRYKNIYIRIFKIRRFFLIDALAQIHPRMSSSMGRSWTAAELMIKFDSIDASGLSDTFVILCFASLSFDLFIGTSKLACLVVPGIIAFLIW